MKEVKIRIKGDLVIVDYCSQNVIEQNIENGEAEDEETAFSCSYYATGAWDKLEALYVDGNEEDNLIKKKGKYIKTTNHFHQLFKEDGEHPLPVNIHYSDYTDVSLDYIIELEDDEEFDIKKVQLIKSEHELELFPYFIVCEKIMYDGREVDTYNLLDYCPEDKWYNEDVIDCYVNDPE